MWTVPNALSFLRLLGVPLFLWLVLGPEADGWALALLAASGVTDYLDGYLARRLNQTSRLGEVLDPVADRLYILAVVIGLALRDIVPWWFAIILPLRDVLLWGLVPILRTFGTVTMTGPFDEISVISSPFLPVPFDGSWLITRPLSTSSEFFSSTVTLKPTFSSAFSASAVFLPAKSVMAIGLGPVETTRLTVVSGLSEVPGLYWALITLPLLTTSL